MTTELSTAAIEAVLEKITSGEWRAESSLQRGHTVWAAVSSTGSMQVAATGYAEFDRINTEFIAAAPAIVRSLLDQNAELQRELEKARAEGRKEAWSKVGDVLSRFSRSIRKVDIVDALEAASKEEE